jgi:uncharacterized protein involved in exopolysaccharide biosynthesis
MQEPQMNEKVPEATLRDLYIILFRHKWKIVLFFLAVVVTVTVGTFLLPEIFQSEARIMVRVGRESVTLDPTATTGQVITVGQSRENEVKSELEILKSQELVEKVVDVFGPAAFLEPEAEAAPASNGSNGGESAFKQAVEKLRATFKEVAALLPNLSLNPLSDRDRAIITVTKGLEIEALKNSDVIAVSFEARGRKLPREALAKLIALYLDKHITVRRTAGSYEFFDRQTRQVETGLGKAEEVVRELKNRTGIASLDDQRKVLLKRIGDLEQDSEATESALAASLARIDTMERTLSALPPTLVTQETSGNPNQGADLMRARLYELQLKEQDLLSKFTETSKPVVEVRRQIAEAQALLGREEPTRVQTTRGLNDAHKQVEVALLTERANATSLRAKAREQRRQLAGARGELKAINDSETRLTHVQREMGIQEANYRKYTEKLEQARIDQALEMGKISNISVVQQATTPVKPVRPKKLLNLVLGVFLGLFGGIGLAFFTEYMTQGFSTPESVERRLGLPVLGTVPFRD